MSFRSETKNSAVINKIPLSERSNKSEKDSKESDSGLDERNFIPDREKKSLFSP
jgi:hypothetical protein